MKNQNKGFFTLTVKVVIVNDKNEILLVKRPKDDHHGAGKWDLPGGNLEEGENILDGVKREIKEEIGIEVKLENIIYVNDFEKKYAEKHDFDGQKTFTNGKGIRILAFYESGEIKLSDEHSEYKWVDISKAEEEFGDSDFEKDKKETLKKAQEYLKMKEALNGWKRTLADFENYKKRQTENQKEMMAFMNENLILELLPILDNFHISTDHIPEDQKNSPWVTGIMHIQKQLEKVLADNGAEEIKVKIGDEFNPEIMESIKNANETNKNTNKTNEYKVNKIAQRGYKINSKVIRATRVIVG